MKNISLRRYALTLMAFSLLPRASHGAACDPPGSAMAAAKATIAAIGAKLTAMEVATIGALKLHAAQMTANLQMLPGALAKIAGAQTQSLSQIAQEGDEARVARDFTPSPEACKTLTTTNQLGNGELVKERYQKQLSLKSHQMNHRLSTTAGSFSAGVESRVAHRLSQYCSDEDVALGICKRKSTRPDADVLVGETLLERKTLETREHQQAAFDLTSTLLKPIPSEPIRSHQMSTPAGREAYLRQKSQEARQNLAQNVFSDMIADRVPLLDSKWMAEILSAQGKGEAAKLPQKISRYEFLELEINRRYENPQWYLDVQSMEPAEVTRQLLHMTALLAKLLWEQKKSLEHIASVQATNLAIVTDQTQPPMPTQTTSLGGKK